MAKIVSRARQLRLDYQAKIGRPVTMQEVAQTVGMTEAALSLLERGKTSRIDFDTLKGLCDFYGVGVGEILEYDPNGILTHGLAPVVMSSL